MIKCYSSVMYIWNIKWSQFEGEKNTPTQWNLKVYKLHYGNLLSSCLIIKIEQYNMLIKGVSPIKTLYAIIIFWSAICLADSFNYH